MQLLKNLSDQNSFIQWLTNSLHQMDCQEQSLQFIIDSTKRIGSDRVTNTGLQLRDTNHVETIGLKSAHFLLIGRTSRKWLIQYESYYEIDAFCKIEIIFGKLNPASSFRNHPCFVHWAHFSCIQCDTSQLMHDSKNMKIRILGSD